MEQTPTTSVLQEAPEKVTLTRTVAAKSSGYTPHPLDRLVEGRMKKVRFVNEDGTTAVMVVEVPYKKPRYERYEPFVNLGKKYPFGSKRQGFTNE